MGETRVINAISTLIPGIDMKKECTKDLESQEVIENPTKPFHIKDDILYKGNMLCIPNGEIRMKLLHDYQSSRTAGHLDESKTLNQFSPYIIERDVRHYQRLR